MMIKPHQKNALLRDMRLTLVLQALLLAAFGMQMVRAAQSISALLLALLAFTLFSFPMIALGNPTLVKVLRGSQESGKLMSVVGFMLLLAFFYGGISGQAHVKDMLLVVIWAAAAAATGRYPLRSFLLDSAFLLILWLPLQLRLLPIILLPPAAATLLPLAFTALAFSIVQFVVFRESEIGFNYRLSGEDLRQIVLNFLLFFMVAVIIAVPMRLMTVSDHLPDGGEIVSRLFLIFFLIALPEELLFRGIIYRLLLKRFSGRWAVGRAVILTALLFGAVKAFHPLPTAGDLFMSASSFNLRYGLFCAFSGFF